MYCQFYGLKEPPFNVTPDSKFLWLSRRHEEALAALVYGVRERKGFICLTGEIGSGKTTLYRTLLSQLDREKTRTAVILNSFLSDVELLKTINEEFGLSSATESKKELLDELNRFLIEQWRAGNNCLLIIDESQNLRPETLEQVRMISNLETETDKLIQILMVGQPQLQRTLALPELEQLAQRITVRHHVTPLNEDEIGEYIQHRLKIGGAQVHVQFPPQSLRLIFHYSKGIPRRINVICDRCLLAGYAAGKYDIDGAMVETAVDEIRGEIRDEDDEPAAEAAPVKRDWRPLLTQVGLAGVLLIIVAGGVLLGSYLRSSTAKDWDAALAPPKPSPTPAAVAAATPEAAAGKAGGKNVPGAKQVAVAGAAMTEITGAAAAGAPGAPTGEGDPAATPPDAAPGTPTPVPSPSPFPYDAFTLDGNQVLRVHRADHALAAAYITLLRAWGIAVDIAPFTERPEEISTFDMDAMVQQLNFHAYTPAALKEAIRLDLPMVVELSASEGEFSPAATILRMRGNLFTVADPVHGMKNVPREKIEPLIQSIKILYKASDALAGLKPGAKGDKVRRLQRAVLGMGEDIGEIDGTFGWMLKEAVSAVQGRCGLPKTGNVDGITASFLAIPEEPNRPKLFS